MAVAVRASSEDARGNTATSTPVKPTGTTSGDLLLAFAASDLDGSLASMTAPTGWSEIGSSSRSDVGFVKVWQKTAGGSEPTTYAFPDSTAANCSVAILALTGHDPSTPVSVAPSFANGAVSNTHPANSVTGVTDGLLLTAHVAGTSGRVLGYTPPSGMTEILESKLSSSAWILLGVNKALLVDGSATGSRIATLNNSATAPYVTLAMVVQPPSSQSLAPTPINSAETFGTPSITLTGSDQTVTAVMIDSGESIGFPVLSQLALPGPFPGTDVYPGATLYPGEAFQPAVDQTISPVTLATLEAFGSPIIGVDDGPLTAIVTAIDSAEMFPVHVVTVDPFATQTVTAVGMDTGEAFGRPSISTEIPVIIFGTWVETYYIDGVSLSTAAARIETAEGFQIAPAPIGNDPELPGLDGARQILGALGQPRRADEIGTITFNMWLKGVDPTTGLIPGGSSTPEQWFARWDALVRLLYRRSVTIDCPRPDGSTRRAIAHLMPGESVAPSRAPSSPWFGRMKAKFAIPGAHWTDISPVTTGQQTLATNSALSLSAFAAATAPCTELTVTFGSGNNPRLSTSWGHIGWNGAIAAGRQLGIDTATHITHQAAGAAWTPGYESLTYSPGPRLFEVDPSEALQAILTFTGGGTMTVEVSGKRRYRTS